LWAILVLPGFTGLTAYGGERHPGEVARDAVKIIFEQI
jgi:hypothetical protein